MSDLVKTIEDQGKRWRRAFLIVVGLSLLSSGAGGFAVYKVQASDEANCKENNDRFRKVRDYLDSVVDQESDDPEDRREFEGLLAVLSPVDC